MYAYPTHDLYIHPYLNMIRGMSLIDLVLSTNDIVQSNLRHQLCDNEFGDF